MKIFAFIPARYGSTRFPGKPLAMILGKPMIQHVYERARACEELTDVFVATDDIRIVDCVESFGGKAVMTSSEHSSGTDRVCEAAGKIGAVSSDIIVNIQGDQPTFTHGLVSQLLRPLVDDASVKMSTLRHRIEDTEEINNPNHVKVVTDKKGFALYFSRHAIPYCREGNSTGVHYKHLGFYCYRMDFLEAFTGMAEGVLESLEKLEQLRALENCIRIMVVETEFDSVEVDVPEDVEIVEKVLLKEGVQEK